MLPSLLKNDVLHTSMAYRSIANLLITSHNIQTTLKLPGS